MPSLRRNGHIFKLQHTNLKKINNWHKSQNATEVKNKTLHSNSKSSIQTNNYKNTYVCVLPSLMNDMLMIYTVFGLGANVGINRLKCSILFSCACACARSFSIDEEQPALNAMKAANRKLASRRLCERWGCVNKATLHCFIHLWACKVRCRNSFLLYFLVLWNLLEIMKAK